MKVLIVDDEYLALNLLEEFLNQIPGTSVVANCKTALDAMRSLREKEVDVMLLDIQMPTLSGVDFLKGLSHPPASIFTTAYRDYAVESYELEVVDYLLKPITFTRFFKSINKYLARLEENKSNISASIVTNTSPSDSENFIYVNTNRKYVKVLFQEVLYIESLKDYVRIHTENQRITTKDKISEFVEK